MLQINQYQSIGSYVYSNGVRSLIQQQGICNVHNFSEDIPITRPEEFNCVKTKMEPPVDICVYPDKMDKWVSRLLNNTGLY